MARELTFSVPLEIPRTPLAKYEFRCYLESLHPQVGIWGKNGEDVGIGFIWETHTGLANAGLHTVSRRMLRALKTTGIIGPRAEPYFLTQRIRYIHDGDANAVFTLREGE